MKEKKVKKYTNLREGRSLSGVLSPALLDQVDELGWSRYRNCRSKLSVDDRLDEPILES